ncbi:hypothetical protein ACFX2C_033884 [Malus domestica]
MSGPSDRRFDLKFGEEAAIPSQDNIWRLSFLSPTKLVYGRGRGNFWWSGEMFRDRKEHQWQKRYVGPTLTLRDES